MPAGYVPFYSLRDEASTATGAAADVGVSSTDVGMELVISGTATVLVEASADGLNWINVSDPIDGYGESTLVVLDVSLPFYRARVTAAVNSSVTAIIGHGRKPDGDLVNVGAVA